MGTNYYLHEDCCAECGLSKKEKLHIGKSSGGWCFSLCVNPEEGIVALEDWIRRLNDSNSIIKNEYGDEISAKDMLSVIKDRGSVHKKKWKGGCGYSSEAEFHRCNRSEAGPNGLVRSKIDGQYCVGHGEGTWDYIAGEFS